MGKQLTRFSEQPSSIEISIVELLNYIFRIYDYVFSLNVYTGWIDGFFGHIILYPHSIYASNTKDSYICQSGGVILQFLIDFLIQIIYNSTNKSL